MKETFQSIGLFIDGGYYAKINEALENNLNVNICMPELFRFIRKQVSQLSGAPEGDCHIVESHYFRGRYRVNEASSKHLLFRERKFEDSLIENDVVFHYKHLREVHREGETTVIEKGVDVWFALEAYELSAIRRFDYVVLITGDADHEMLLRKLKAQKIRAILLTWDVTQGTTTSTARMLREEAYAHIELSELVANDKNLLNSLCR